MTVPAGHVRVKKRQELLRPQAEMIEYDKQWGGARGGTRAGKSLGFALWLFLKRVQKYPLANHVVVGADYEQLRRGFYDLLIGLLENTFGWREGIDYRYRETPSPTLHFLRLGKRVRVRSLSTRLTERIRGMSIQTLLLEEPGTWGTKTKSGKDTYELLVGRLAHSQATAILYPDLHPQGRLSFNPTSAPEGSWLYDMIEGPWKVAGFKCWKMSVRHNYMLQGREEYIAGLRVAFNPRRWPSEIDGEWARGGGNAYYGYDPKVHEGYDEDRSVVTLPSGLPPTDWFDDTQPLCWTHDFNVNRMCSLIAQQWRQERILLPGVRYIKTDRPAHEQYTVAVPGWQPNIIRWLAEFALGTPEESSSAPQVLEAFLESEWYEKALIVQRKTKGNGVLLFGDPAGHQRNQALDARRGANTNWKILYNGLRQEGIRVGFRVARKDPGPQQRVNAQNAQFRNGEGPGCTMNGPALTVWKNDLRNMNWKPNGFDLDKVPGKQGDSSDAADYMVHRLRSSNFVLKDSVLDNRAPA